MLGTRQKCDYLKNKYLYFDIKILIIMSCAAYKMLSFAQTYTSCYNLTEKIILSLNKLTIYFFTMIDPSPPIANPTLRAFGLL